MIRSKVKGINRGKHPIILNGQAVKTTIFIDGESLFIMVKNKRINVKQNFETKRYYIK